VSHDSQIVVPPNGTLLDFFSEVHIFNNSDGGTQFDANLTLLRSPEQGQTWLPQGLRLAR
jgi:hypothetical protein